MHQVEQVLGKRQCKSVALLGHNSKKNTQEVVASKFIALNPKLSQALTHEREKSDGMHLSCSACLLVIFRRSFFWQFHWIYLLGWNDIFVLYTPNNTNFTSTLQLFTFFTMTICSLLPQNCICWINFVSGLNDYLYILITHIS